jgi:hypothetical protein
MPGDSEVTQFFSTPREPNTSLMPGQFFDRQVPDGTQVVVTDIYVENLGDGDASLEILEERSPDSFELRYVYRIKANQTLNVNLSTGLRLGDETPIRDRIRMQNSGTSGSDLLIRVNGRLVK